MIENIEEALHSRYTFGNTVLHSGVYKWSIKYVYDDGYTAFAGICTLSTKDKIVQKSVVENKNTGTLDSDFDELYGYKLDVDLNVRLDNYIHKRVKLGTCIHCEMNMNTGEFKMTYEGQVVGTKNLKGK